MKQPVDIARKLHPQTMSDSANHVLVPRQPGLSTYYDFDCSCGEVIKVTHSEVEMSR